MPIGRSVGDLNRSEKFVAGADAVADDDAADDDDAAAVQCARVHLPLSQKSERKKDLSMTSYWSVLRCGWHFPSSPLLQWVRYGE